MPGRFFTKNFQYYFVAGAAGAAGASGAAGAPGAGVASGAGAGAGAGAGVSTAAGFCSSAFLHPTTANDNVTTKSRERKIANIFFIDVHLLSKIFKRRVLKLSAPYVKV